FLNFTGDGVQQAHGGLPGDWAGFRGNLFTLDSFQFSLVAVPEPGTGLILVGLGCLAAVRRRA
ncbi:MAG: PEP-CTERM sorting domain-containing protein, partial [bacterium]|nr:PEP-CTERM sorting domain-containing protein [bacterium]